VKTLLGVTILSLVALFLWLIDDYFFVKSGQPINYWSTGFIEKLAFLLLVLGYFTVSYRTLELSDVVKKLFISLLITAIAVPSFIFLSFLIVLNFHLFIGGTL
jgi:hypothetical protein